MNYIDDLTQDEKVELCTIISGRWFRELFKSNEQEFTKLRKGFRAKSLTEEAALSTAIANVDKPFIVYFIQRMADGWLRKGPRMIMQLQAHCWIPNLLIMSGCILN